MSFMVISCCCRSAMKRMHDTMQSSGDRSIVHFLQSSIAVQASVSLSQWLLPFTCRMLLATQWTNMLQLIPWYVHGLACAQRFQQIVHTGCKCNQMKSQHATRNMYHKLVAGMVDTRSSVSTYLSCVNMWVPSRGMHGRCQLLPVQTWMSLLSSQCIKFRTILVHDHEW